MPGIWINGEFHPRGYKSPGAASPAVVSRCLWQTGPCPRTSLENPRPVCPKTCRRQDVLIEGNKSRFPSHRGAMETTLPASRGWGASSRLGGGAGRRWAVAVHGMLGMVQFLFGNIVIRTFQRYTRPCPARRGRQPASAGGTVLRAIADTPGLCPAPPPRPQGPHAPAPTRFFASGDINLHQYPLWGRGQPAAARLQRAPGTLQPLVAAQNVFFVFFGKLGLQAHKISWFSAAALSVVKKPTRGRHYCDTIHHCGSGHVSGARDARWEARTVRHGRGGAVTAAAPGGERRRAGPRRARRGRRRRERVSAWGRMGGGGMARAGGRVQHRGRNGSGRGPDAGRTVGFKATDADRTRAEGESTPAPHGPRPVRFEIYRAARDLSASSPRPLSRVAGNDCPGASPGE
eukprot:gene13972-biopygen8062